jgi:hypothetical protein
MRYLIVTMALFAVSSIAHGQTYHSKLGGEKVRPMSTPPPHVSQRGEVQGAVPRAVKGGNPAQMLNPLAPARYGTAAQSVLLEPYTGKWNGIKLFEIFW